MTITYVWRVETQQEYGVALIVTPEVANMIEDVEPINNRMVHMAVSVGREKPYS